MSTTASYRDAFPEPTATRYDRGRNKIQIRPYYHSETGRAPQEEFLAGPEDKAAIKSEARNHAFISGLGAGKTAAGVLRSVANAERWNPGELGMIVAPTVPALKNAIIPVMREFGLFDAWDYHGKGSEEPGIHTPSGSRIILESADNARKIERLRGPNLAWFWMDEAASISERAWEIMSGRLRTGDYRNASITTTPKGKNWVYERFRDPPDPDSVNGVFGVPSWLNPHNPDDYIERLEAEYSGTFFEQEVKGAFTQFEGLVYPWFDEDNVVADTPDTYDEVIYGVDWGFRNPAVILAIVRQGDRWVVVEEFYESRCTDDDHADAAEDFQDRWGPGRFYCDPSEPANIETFRRRGLDARPAENDVIPGIQHVTAMEDELRVVDACQSVINEFGQYQYKDSDDRDDPIKQNDHAMDGLRYALFTHENGPQVTRRRRHSTPSKHSIHNE